MNCIRMIFPQKKYNVGTIQIERIYIYIQGYTHTYINPQIQLEPLQLARQFIEEIHAQTYCDLMGIPRYPLFMYKSQ